MEQEDHRRLRIRCPQILQTGHCHYQSPALDYHIRPAQHVQPDRQQRYSLFSSFLMPHLLSSHLWSLLVDFVGEDFFRSVEVRHCHLALVPMVDLRLHRV